MNIKEYKNFICGANILLPTPFKKNLNIDFKSLENNVKYLIDNGVKKGNSILKPTSSDGEYALLSTEEQKEVIQCVVEASKNIVPVVPGTFHTDFKRTIEITKFAETTGAAAVM